MRRSLLFMMIMILSLGCYKNQPAVRGVDANYRIEVTNTMPHAMNVSLDTGGGLTVLGQVAAGQTRTFEITDPMANQVEIIAVDPDGNETERKEIELSRTETAKVKLDPDHHDDD